MTKISKASSDIQAYFNSGVAYYALNIFVHVVYPRPHPRCSHRLALSLESPFRTQSLGRSREGMVLMALCMKTKNILL